MGENYETSCRSYMNKNNYLFFPYVAFPIERSHLADFHFQDTGQNVKLVAKIKKMFVHILLGKGALLQIQSVLMRESAYNRSPWRRCGKTTTLIKGPTWTLQSLK